MCPVNEDMSISHWIDSILISRKSLLVLVSDLNPKNEVGGDGNDQTGASEIQHIKNSNSTGLFETGWDGEEAVKMPPLANGKIYQNADFIGSNLCLIHWHHEPLKSAA